MSKVVIGVDTITGELIVSVDGKELDKVNSINIYKYENYDDEDKVGIDISIYEESEEKGGLKKSTRLYASKRGIESPSVAVHEQISNYITSPRRV